jgi:hypothetical protein
VREYISSASSPGLHPAVLDRLVRPWLGDPGQAAFYRQIAQADQLYTDEVQHRYGEIDIPTLVCWGQDDTQIVVAHDLLVAGQVAPGGQVMELAHQLRDHRQALIRDDLRWLHRLPCHMAVQVIEHLAAGCVDAEVAGSSLPAALREQVQQFVDEWGIPRRRAAHRLTDPHNFTDKTTRQPDL